MSRLGKLRCLRDRLAKRVAESLIPGPNEDERDLERHLEEVLSLGEYCGLAANSLRFRCRPFEWAHVDDVRRLCKVVQLVAVAEARMVPKAPEWHAGRIKTMRDQARKSTTRACIESVIERGTFH